MWLFDRYPPKRDFTDPFMDAWAKNPDSEGMHYWWRDQEPVDSGITTDIFWQNLLGVETEAEGPDSGVSGTSHEYGIFGPVEYAWEAGSLAVWFGDITVDDIGGDGAAAGSSWAGDVRGGFMGMPIIPAGELGGLAMGGDGVSYGDYGAIVSGGYDGGDGGEGGDGGGYGGAAGGGDGGAGGE